MSSDLQAARLAARMQREIHSLQREPPPGVCAWPSNDTSLTRLEAQIEGPDGTVYAKGIFKLEIQVPERYPFEPPNVRFVTPVYHPNIDNGGRICLDILNLPPKGSWRPSINIATVLTSIRVLLSEPNPDDGLMGDISAEYKRNRADFEIKAKLWTQKYSAQNQDNLDVLPMDVLYPVSKQEPNRVNDSIEIHNGQAEAVAKESGYKNKGSGEFKNNRPSILVKLTEPAGRKLSLAKACATGTPQLLPPNDVLTDCQNKVDDKSKNFCTMQNVNPVLQHNVSDSSSMETPSFSSMLVANNKNNDSLDATKTITIAESRNAQSSSLMGKENYHPYLKVNRLSKLSMSTAVSCDRKNSLKAHKSTETDTRNSETEANVPAEHRNELKHSKMQKIQLQKPRTFATSKYSSLKGDFGSMKTSAVEIEAASDSPTILVSDSESDEEPSPRRSRLSISQRLLAGKRKRG